jgi:uncharacterized damage-inducible protein DinB
VTTTLESLSRATEGMPAAEPFVHPLLIQIGFNHAAFHLNVDGISHAESLTSPGASGNCLNWVVGHIVAARQRWLATVLGGKPTIDITRLPVYARGAQRLVDGAGAVRLEELVAAYDAAQAPLLAGMAALTPERMGEKAPFSPGNDPRETIGSLVAKLTYHEGYHTGQTGILRRMLGHAAGGIA